MLTIKLIKKTFVILAMLMMVVVNGLYASPVDTFTFKDEATKLRFQTLSKELRCPKCQNQNLSDSNSPIAADLRLMVYKQLQENKSDEEIIDYMVYRYGDFVLYRPQVNSMTYVLWYGPLLLLVACVFVLIIVVRKRAKNKSSEQNNLTQAQQTELEDIINNK